MVTEPVIEPGADADRVRAAYGFRLVTSRAPTPNELDLIVAMFRRRPDWTLVANALLNLDETITKE